MSNLLLCNSQVDDHRWILNQEDIQKSLGTYHPDARFLSHAELNNEKLCCQFRTFTHPFHNPNPQHLTREHVVVFVTQACYTLTHQLCKSKINWPLNAKQFLTLSSTENATIRHLSINFKKFVANKNVINLTLKKTKDHLSRKYFVLNFSFDIEKGINGTCEAVIVLDGSLKLNQAIQHDLFIAK